MRNEKSGTRYFSFAELAEAWGIKPQKKTNNAKRKEQIEKFNTYHRCQTCKRPLTYIGGNIMVCQNDKCPGIKHTRKDDETGEEKVWYSPSFEELTNKFADYANYLFED